MALSAKWQYNAPEISAPHTEEQCLEVQHRRKYAIEDTGKVGDACQSWKSSSGGWTRSGLSSGDDDAASCTAAAGVC